MCFNINEIFILTISIIFVVIFVCIIVTYENRKYERDREKYKMEQKNLGKDMYDITMKYICGVYVSYKDRKYYLHNDGNFYDDSSLAKTFEFDNEEKMENFINENTPKLVSIYGDSVGFFRRQMVRRTPYCRKLDISKLK